MSSSIQWLDELTHEFAHWSIQLMNRLMSWFRSSNEWMIELKIVNSSKEEPGMKEHHASSSLLLLFTIGRDTSASSCLLLCYFSVDHFIFQIVNCKEEEAGIKKYPCIPQLVIIASPSIITLITFYYIHFMKPLQDQIIIVHCYILFLNNIFCLNHLSEKRWRRAAVVKSIATFSSLLLFAWS